VAAAVVAPAAILGAALTVGLFGGGIGGVASLRQAFAGPTQPVIEPERDAGGRSARDSGRLLARAIRTRRADPVAAALVARQLELRQRQATERRREARRRAREERRRRRARPTPTPTATPAPDQTAEPPSAIRQVGDQAKEVTDEVPVAGEPAGDTIDLVVETVEESPLPDLPELPDIPGVPAVPLP
jgi:hypothetical protein